VLHLYLLPFPVGVLLTWFVIGAPAFLQVDLNLAQFEQQVKASFPHLHLHWRRVMGQTGEVAAACTVICFFL
jgi:uncharacterized membrane protein YciS (DUF1049 family)